MFAFGNVTPRITCARLAATANDDDPADAGAEDDCAAGKVICPTATAASSAVPAGYLPALRKYDARSMACGLVTLPAACGGIVFSILSTRSPSERVLQVERKPLPASGGPTTPSSASPWQVTHCALYSC